MAKLKAELAQDRDHYYAQLQRCHEAHSAADYETSLEAAASACEYIDGMMQFEHRYENRESWASIESVDFVFRFAPLLFDTPRINRMAALLKTQKRIAELEARKRAISQAQLTKAGHVYVISNIGSFGENVFKIGMTRRLEPQDRIYELGSASVPFPFDVHMMISCNNAPSLESALHQQFSKQQVNKTNPRKEFFRTDIESIAQAVREHHGEVTYVAAPAATQYHDSLTMPDEDRQYIEDVYDRFDEDLDDRVDGEPLPVMSGEP